MNLDRLDPELTTKGFARYLGGFMPKSKHFRAKSEHFTWAFVPLSTRKEETKRHYSRFSQSLCCCEMEMCFPFFFFWTACYVKNDSTSFHKRDRLKWTTSQFLWERAGGAFPLSEARFISSGETEGVTFHLQEVMNGNRRSKSNGVLLLTKILCFYCQGIGSFT